MFCYLIYFFKVNIRSVYLGILCLVGCIKCNELTNINRTAGRLGKVRSEFSLLINIGSKVCLHMVYLLKSVSSYTKHSCRTKYFTICIVVRIRNSSQSRNSIIFRLCDLRLIL